MNITTRTLIAVPLAAAALSAGSTPVMADVPDFQFVVDKDGPNPDPGPQDGPDDKDGPNHDPGPDGPDDLDGPNHDDDDDDSDDDDDDSDDSDDDDGDSGGNDVRRPTRVDAGDADDDLSFAWLLASGAMVTAAGGFTARRAALKRL